MSFVVGLTGPTGSGKSSVTKIAQNLGFKVIDCDNLARVATQSGSDGLADLVKVFGENILNQDGTLNRKALANAAFDTPEQTELLNKTLLPHIVKLIKEQINAPKVMLDAPTLFESGADSLCNKTIAVLCDTDTRKARIMQRDGIDESAAVLRIKAGKDDNFYMEKADYIVHNNCEFNLFETKIKQILTDILGGKQNV